MNILRILLFTSLLVSSTRAAVHSLDLGAQSFLIGNVKQGGQMDVVLNRYTKRFSPTRVALDNGRVSVGSDALAVAGRTSVISATGYLPWDTSYTPTPVGPASTCTPYMWWTPTSTAPLCLAPYLGPGVVDRLTALALTLRHAADITAEDTGASVENVAFVPVVPPFATLEQRGQLLAAADAAGVTIKDLISVPSAVTLHYLTGQFSRLAQLLPDKTTKTVAVCDLGHSAALCGTVKLTRVDKTRTTTLVENTFVFSEVFSGATIDQRLTTLVTARAGAGPATRVQRDALGIAINKAKHTLGAVDTVRIPTPFAPAPTVTLTASDLAEIVSELMPELEPVLAALPAPATSDYLGLVLVGGIARIPSVRAKFSTQTLLPANAEEAAVLGAGFYAAQLSAAFKSKETVVVKEPVPATLSLAISGAEGVEGAQEGKEIVPIDGLTTGGRRRVRVQREEDFSIKLSLAPAGAADDNKVVEGEVEVKGVAGGRTKICKIYEDREAELQTLLDRIQTSLASAVTRHETELADMKKADRKKAEKKHRDFVVDSGVAIKAVEEALTNVQNEHQTACPDNNKNIDVVFRLVTHATGTLTTTEAAATARTPAPLPPALTSKNVAVADVLRQLKLNDGDGKTLALTFSTHEVPLTLVGATTLSATNTNTNTEAEAVVATACSLYNDDRAAADAANGAETAAYAARDLAERLDDIESGLDDSEVAEVLRPLARQDVVEALNTVARAALNEVEESHYLPTCSALAAKTTTSAPGYAATTAAANSTAAAAALAECLHERARAMDEVLTSVSTVLTPAQAAVRLLERYQEIESTIRDNVNNVVPIAESLTAAAAAAAAAEAECSEEWRPSELAVQDELTKLLNEATEAENKRRAAAEAALAAWEARQALKAANDTTDDTTTTTEDDDADPRPEPYMQLTADFSEDSAVDRLLAKDSRYIACVGLKGQAARGLEAAQSLEDHVKAANQALDSFTAAAAAPALAAAAGDDEAEAEGGEDDVAALLAAFAEDLRASYASVRAAYSTLEQSARSARASASNLSKSAEKQAERLAAKVKAAAEAVAAAEEVHEAVADEL